MCGHVQSRSREAQRRSRKLRAKSACRGEGPEQPGVTAHPSAMFAITTCAVLLFKGCLPTQTSAGLWQETADLRVTTCTALKAGTAAVCSAPRQL